MSELSLSMGDVAGPRTGAAARRHALDAGQASAMPAPAPLPERPTPGAADDRTVPGLIGAYMAVFRLFS